MLIADCLKSIYYRFEKSNEDPDTTEEDFDVRLEYCNAAIGKWEDEIGMKWKELMGTISGTLVNGVFNNQTTLADFKRPDGYLWIGTDKYEYVKPNRVDKEVAMFPTKKIYTVTGSKGSFSINVYPSISGAFTLNYVKYANRFVTGAETTPIQMSDPEFIIYDVLTQLYLEDDNNTQTSVMSQIATEKMNSMKLNNEIDPTNNNSNFPDDDFSGFGN